MTTEDIELRPITIADVVSHGVLIGTGATVGAMSVWPAASATALTTPYFYEDPVVAGRRAVAMSFARIVRNMAGIQEVWLTETKADLEVAVMVDETDLDRELEIRGIFIDLVCERLDPSVGELFIYPSDDAPSWVYDGQRLWVHEAELVT